MFLPQIYTDGSLLHSTIRIKDIPKICKDYGYDSLPLTDVSNMSHSIEYYETMKSAGLKPVFGLQLKICQDFACVKTPDNKANEKITILAKNKEGWNDLIYLFNYSNKAENFYDEGRLSLKDISRENLITENLIVLDKKTHQIPESRFIGDQFNTRLLDAIRLKTDISKISDISHEKLPNVDDLTDDQRSYFETLFDQIDEYDIIMRQKLPSFDTQGDDEDSYLYNKCLSKLKELNLPDSYLSRLKLECETFKKAGMSGYFLVLADIINYLRSCGRLLGVGRGSAGGCLVSYLSGITMIDPIQHNLIFERFYTADRGGYPDIDFDIPTDFRPQLCEYIKKKYGKERFAQICTFLTLKGASSLKAVFRGFGTKMSFLEQNEISKSLPKEGRVDSELKDQTYKSLPNKSLLLFNLINEPDSLSKWCTYNVEDESFSGENAREFEIAIELDGLLFSRGSHASAFVLSDRPLDQLVPMFYDDKKEQPIVGLDMNASEKRSLVKLDILGLDLLNKCETAVEILKNGISPEEIQGFTNWDEI